MITAYVLIQTEVGEAGQVLAATRHEEAHDVLDERKEGGCDIGFDHGPGVKSTPS